MLVLCKSLLVLGSIVNLAASEAVAEQHAAATTAIQHRHSHHGAGFTNADTTPIFMFNKNVPEICPPLKSRRSGM